MREFRNFVRSLARGLGLKKSRQPMVVIQLPPYALRQS